MAAVAGAVRGTIEWEPTMKKGQDRRRSDEPGTPAVAQQLAAASDTDSATPQPPEPQDDDPPQVHEHRPGKKRHRPPYGQQRQIRWKKLSLLFAVTAILAIAAGNFYLKRSLRNASGHNESVEIPPPLPWKPPRQEASERPKPAADSITQTPVAAPSPSAPLPLQLLRSGDLPAAARAWQRELSGQPSSRFTIQLELACRTETIADILTALPDPSQLRVIPLQFKGQTCYRVLCGLYASETAAREAINEVPRAFRDQRFPPRVMRLAEILEE
jgi:septal ring-binding cell division protein DamX